MVQVGEWGKLRNGAGIVQALRLEEHCRSGLRDSGSGWFYSRAQCGKVEEAAERVSKSCRSVEAVAARFQFALNFLNPPIFIKIKSKTRRIKQTIVRSIQIN